MTQIAIEDAKGKRIVNVFRHDKNHDLYIVFDDNSFAALEGESDYDSYIADIRNQDPIDTNVTSFNYPILYQLGIASQEDFDVFEKRVQDAARQRELSQANLNKNMARLRLKEILAAYPEMANELPANDPQPH